MTFVNRRYRDCEITLLSVARLAAACILRTEFSAAAEQQKLQFFLLTFHQKRPSIHSEK